MEPITIYIDGPLDALHLNDLQENVNSLDIQEGQFVILDCTEMNYISSSGLRVFLSMHKDVTAKNGKLIIKNLQPLVKHVFDMTGFSQIFNFE
ncbi:MAG: STAS domain-containing protein [Bacteroidaceae bacterium]|jgi:anti-anti-sigma factor|nr:STAS domain-containing protein [Bacteroidaceae bacterium]